jgi:signal transduction histidine kinase
MPPIICSEDLLQQVFLNVGLNAFQAMPTGGRLTIITQSSSREPGMDAEPEWIEAIFRDTGVGIPSEDLKKVFDPFFSTKPSGEGTGLGLYVSYQIVSNHGGEIQVESQPGRGTTVKIILPISHEEDSQL